MAGGWGWFLQGGRVGLEVGWAGAQRSDVEGRGQGRPRGHEALTCR